MPTCLQLKPERMRVLFSTVPKEQGPLQVHRHFTTSPLSEAMRKGVDPNGLVLFTRFSNAKVRLLYRAVFHAHQLCDD